MRNVALLSVFLAVFLLAACEQSPTLVRAEGAVTVYVVVSPRSQSSAADSALYALVAQQDGPFDARYLTATEFSLRRINDGVAFAWQWTGREGSLPPSFTNDFAPTDGNYRLPASVHADSLSHWNVAPGDSIALTVVLSDRTVLGRSRIPLLPTPTVVTEGDSTVAYWPRDPHAAAYWVVADSENGPSRFQSDTSLRLLLDRLPENRGPVAFLRVFALDSGLARFVNDESVVSAGLSGANGVFGAVTADSVQVPDSLLIDVQASPQGVGGGV